MGNVSNGRDSDEAAAESALVWLGLTPEEVDRLRVAITLPVPQESRQLPVAVDEEGLTELGDVLDAEAFERIAERVAAHPMKLVPDDFSARCFPARVYGNWLQALGLPDLAEQVRNYMADITLEGAQLEAFIANASTSVRNGRGRTIMQTRVPQERTHTADTAPTLQTRVETTYDEGTDADVTYMVQSHRSFLADVALIDGRELILHPRVRDREPTPDEIRELAAALNVVAAVLQEAQTDAGSAEQT